MSGIESKVATLLLVICTSFVIATHYRIESKSGNVIIISQLKSL